MDKDKYQKDDVAIIFLKKEMNFGSKLVILIQMLTFSVGKKQSASTSTTPRYFINLLKAGIYKSLRIASIFSN